MLPIVFLWLFVATEAAAAQMTIDDICPPSLLDAVDPEYLQERDGWCFHFVTYSPKTYKNANKDCLRDGGTLALPKTEALNTYLADQLANHYKSPEEAWIGLHDQKEELTFVWEDDTELRWSNFARFEGPEQDWLDMDVLDCVAMNPAKDGLWYDKMCKGDIISWIQRTNHTKQYVCQYPPAADVKDDTKHTGAVVDTCPTSLLEKADAYYLQVHDGSCFHFALTEKKPYAEANDECLKDKGTLALPKTKALNDFLVDELANYYNKLDKVWIGLHDLEQESNFVWEDGSGLVWSNFADDNGPGNTWLAKDVEDCVALNPKDGGKWHDFQCDHNLLSWIAKPNPSKMYICQY